MATHCFGIPKIGQYGEESCSLVPKNDILVICYDFKVWPEVISKLKFKFKFNKKKK